MHLWKIYHLEKMILAVEKEIEVDHDKFTEFSEKENMLQNELKTHKKMTAKSNKTFLLYEKQLDQKKKELSDKVNFYLFRNPIYCKPKRKRNI